MSDVQKLIPQQQKGRNYNNWINDYVAFTGYSNSPEIYRRWVALAVVSSVLQRKVFVRVNGSQIFPNLYVMLCGGPGLGKSQAMNPGRNMLSRLDHITLSPARVTPEKLIQLVSKSLRTFPLGDDPFFTQSAYSAFLSEMSTFIQPKDVGIMTMLTDWFDCPTTWTYGTIARDTDRIENMFFTMIGGITPKALAENLGSVAFGMGFTARLNIIYSNDYKPPQLFAREKPPEFEPFVEDLKRMQQMHGEFKFAPDAAAELQGWVDQGMPPAPSDGRLGEYLPRRWLHLIKLCMAFSACEDGAMTITMRHLHQARAALLEYEAVLPRALEFMGTNPMMEGIRNIHNWMVIEYAQTKKPIPEKIIKFKLLNDVGPQYINQTLVEMANSGYVTMVVTGDTRAYVPI